MKLMYLSKPTAKNESDTKTVEFVDSLLAKGIMNDHFFDQILFNAKFILNPDEIEMFDAFKQLYVSINPPSPSMKMSKYNEIVRTNMQGRESEVFNDVLFERFIGVLYRKLWEDTYLKTSKQTQVIESNGDWILDIWFNMGEALSFIHSTVLGQKDVHDKVNKLITSTEAVYNMMNELLLDEDPNRQTRFTAVFMTTLRIGEFRHESSYNMERINLLKSLIKNKAALITDVQGSMQSIDDIIDRIDNGRALPEQGPMIYTICADGLDKLRRLLVSLSENRSNPKITSIERNKSEVYITFAIDGGGEMNAFFAKECVYPSYVIFKNNNKCIPGITRGYYLNL